MKKKQKRPPREAASELRAAPASAPPPASRLREWLAGTVGQFLIGPFLAMIIAPFLLVGGIFLEAAWIVGPKPLLDAHRYRAFTGVVNGSIVESWAALEFDPRTMGQKRRWPAFAKITACAVVEYPGDWGVPMRRAFCGDRFTFGEEVNLHEWSSLGPGMPFAFLRDESGFMLQEVRMSRTAFDWLQSNPPYDTFMLSKPPPGTALGALQEQFDRPATVAVTSWTTPFPLFPLAYDPRHREEAMPAQYVADRGLKATWALGLVLGAVMAVPGFKVWRAGVTLLFPGQRPAMVWICSLVPLLALPWWGDVLPRLIRPVNADWASIAADMLDDFGRTSRLVASAPEDAALADGERVVWRLDRGAYADTFGKFRFERPPTPPATKEGALGALREEVGAQVRKLDASEQASLFARLEAQKHAGLGGCQTLFTSAAEQALRDRETDPAARRAARHFLSFGMGYNNWDLDALGR